MAGTTLQQIHALQQAVEKLQRENKSLKKDIKEIKLRLDVGVIRYGNDIK